MKPDVIIIGAGPAGISCALECIENKLNPLVLEKNSEIGGQLSLIPSPIMNFAGGAFDNGSELKERLKTVTDEMLSEYIKKGIAVQSVDLKNKMVFSDTGEFTADSIVIATGYRFRKLPIAFQNSHENNVFYGNNYDKSQFSKRRICIIGGGDSALLLALDVVDRCKETHLVIRSDQFRARPDVIEDIQSDPRIIVHENTSLEKTLGAEKLEAVKLQNGMGPRIVPCDDLLIKIGYVPNTELFVGQLDMDRDNHIIVDAHGETSVKGVFAAGDIVHDGYDRVAYATGSGVMAAKGVRRLMKHSV